MNIYGDMRTCIKCKMKADVVEKGKDYCVSCWFKHFEGMTIEEYEKKNKDLNVEKYRINYKRSEN